MFYASLFHLNDPITGGKTSGGVWDSVSCHAAMDIIPTKNLCHRCPYGRGGGTGRDLYLCNTTDHPPGWLIWTPYRANGAKYLERASIALTAAIWRTRALGPLLMLIAEERGEKSV